MSERYWVTGVQLGMLEKGILSEKETAKIYDDQFIGNARLVDEQEKFEIKVKQLLR